MADKNPKTTSGSNGKGVVIIYPYGQREMKPVAGGFMAKRPISQENSEIESSQSL
jgi:hypothetical protein